MQVATKNISLSTTKVFHSKPYGRFRVIKSNLRRNFRLQIKAAIFFEVVLAINDLRDPCYPKFSLNYSKSLSQSKSHATLYPF